MQRPVRIITDPKIARILVDPMRREIVRLLAESERTENDLAQTLGLSDPSVGHHLKVLKNVGLIRVARRKAEEHGILQKFYESNAIVYLVDSHNMSKEIDRYFMPISLERVRGIIAAAGVILGETIQLTENDAEKLAKSFASAVIKVSGKFSRPWRGTREELLTCLYTAAITLIVKEPAEMPEKVMKFLTRAFGVRIH